MPNHRDTAFDKALGANIRFARIAAKLSQTALGQAIGVTFQQVQKYEKGKDRVAVANLVRIAAAVGKSVAELLDVKVELAPSAEPAREAA